MLINFFLYSFVTSDLCLDELEVNLSNESNPCKMTIISPRSVNLGAKKEEARKSGTHLALLLDGKI